MYFVKSDMILKFFQVTAPNHGSELRNDEIIEVETTEMNSQLDNKFVDKPESQVPRPSPDLNPEKLNPKWENPFQTQGGLSLKSHWPT